MRKVPSIDKVVRLEATYKLLYLLRDLGIKSAHEPAKQAWTAFMQLIVDSDG